VHVANPTWSFQLAEWKQKSSFIPVRRNQSFTLEMNLLLSTLATIKYELTVPCCCLDMTKSHNNYSPCQTNCNVLVGSCPRGLAIGTAPAIVYSRSVNTRRSNRWNAWLRLKMACDQNGGEQHTSPFLKSHDRIYWPLRKRPPFFPIFIRMFDMFYEETMQPRARRAFRRVFKKPYLTLQILCIVL
jgi:hypothetical protein